MSIQSIDDIPPLIATSVVRGSEQGWCAPEHIKDSLGRNVVLSLYYDEGLTLAEIGDVLSVTESRVCQIHAKSVMSLRNRLSGPVY